MTGCQAAVLTTGTLKIENACSFQMTSAFIYGKMGGHPRKGNEKGEERVTKKLRW
jgi:hypothetical protein